LRIVLHVQFFYFSKEGKEKEEEEKEKRKIRVRSTRVSLPREQK